MKGGQNVKKMCDGHWVLNFKKMVKCFWKHTKRRVTDLKFIENLAFLESTKLI